MRAPIRSALVVLVAALGALAGCGEDDEPVTQQPIPATGARPGTPAGAGGARSKVKLLAEKMHIEDRVACPIPDRPSDPKNGKCDPRAPACPEHLYCLELAQGSYCEPCPERAGIRHAFRNSDFVVDQNRDPFESSSIGKAPAPGSQPPGVKCRRDDQMVATTYSYLDLKLVGIVAQGVQRKVLMMGGPLGYIIKRGDCVGKEKAVVTDIGTGYITFQIDPDPSGLSQRPPTRHSVPLYPKQVAVTDPSELPAAPRTMIAPMATPPVPSSPAPGGTPPAGTAAGSAQPEIAAPAANKR
jgi:hypothetical protein